MNFWEKASSAENNPAIWEISKNVTQTVAMVEALWDVTQMVAMGEAKCGTHMGIDLGNVAHPTPGEPQGGLLGSQKCKSPGNVMNCRENQ